VKLIAFNFHLFTLDSATLDKILPVLMYDDLNNLRI
jgi:hypothetical protein